MKYSDEKQHMTINDIKEKLYELNNDFQIDFRAIKKYVTIYNEYYEDNIIESYKKGRNLYFYSNKKRNYI